MWGYLKLAVPSAFMVSIDWWTWELMILISGWIRPEEEGKISQAACITIMNIVASAYMVAMGLEAACNTLVGV